MLKHIERLLLIDVVLDEDVFYKVKLRGLKRKSVDGGEEVGWFQCELCGNVVVMYAKLKFSWGGSKGGGRKGNRLCSSLHYRPWQYNSRRGRQAAKSNGTFTNSVWKKGKKRLYVEPMVHLSLLVWSLTSLYYNNTRIHNRFRQLAPYAHDDGSVV